MKKINLSWTSDIVHYSKDEPNLIHVENLDQTKARPDFFNAIQSFGAKIVPRRPLGHNMR